MRLLHGGSLATGSKLPWRERRDFYPEGVASGDPDRESILLWTRRPLDRNAVEKLSVEVAEDDFFKRVVATAEAAMAFPPQAMQLYFTPVRVIGGGTLQVPLSASRLFSGVIGQIPVSSISQGQFTKCDASLNVASLTVCADARSGSRILPGKVADFSGSLGLEFCRVVAEGFGLGMRKIDEWISGGRLFGDAIIKPAVLLA